MPGVLIIEAMSQMGGVLLSQELDRRHRLVQARGLREIAGVPFAHIDQRANHPEIACADGVVRFHGLESPAVKCRHEETFGQIVQVLGERQYVVTFLARGGVHHAALHARAPAAVGVPGQVFSGALQNRLLAVEIGNAELLQQWLQRRGIEAGNEGIYCDGAKVEPDRRVFLQLVQDVQQCVGVLAPGHGDGDPVAVCDGRGREASGVVSLGPEGVIRVRIRSEEDRVG